MNPANQTTTTILGSYIQTQKGYAFKSKWYSDHGKPIVKVSNLTERSVNVSDLTYIPNDIAANYSKYTLTTDDIIIQTVGSWPSNPQSVVGKVVRVPSRASGALLNQNAVKVDPALGLDKKFLFYLLKGKAFKQYIVGCAQGAASQASITLEDIRKFRFALPPIPTQRKIASVLSAYDDLIENNTRRIEILEEMAQRIYREWFVDFRFPGYEKVEMVDSELGLIPEGWEIRKASDALLINPKTKVPKEGEKCFVPMGSLSNNSMLINGTEIRSGNSGSKFKNGDTLFARITPSLENGKTGYVQFLPKDDVAFGSTEFVVLRSRTLCSEYVYLLARSNEFRDNAIKSMTGASGRQRVQEQCFDNFLLAHPDPETLGKFSKVVSALFHSVYVLAKKNENLRHTRDLLLPKLVSGEVDVENLNDKIGGEGY